AATADRRRELVLSLLLAVPGEELFWRLLAYRWGARQLSSTLAAAALVGVGRAVRARRRPRVAALPAAAAGGAPLGALPAGGAGGGGGGAGGGGRRWGGRVWGPGWMRPFSPHPTPAVAPAEAES